MSRGVWEVVEAKAGEVRMAEATGGRKEERSRKKARRKREEEKEKENAKERKKDRSMKDSRRI